MKRTFLYELLSYQRKGVGLAVQLFGSVGEVVI